MKTINIYICIWATLFLMFLSITRPSGVYAAEIEKEICRINIQCGRQDMKWSLYRIGDVADDSSITYNEKFRKYLLPKEPVSYDEIQDLTAHFENYINSSGNDPEHSGITDESGRLSFTVDEGWYIAIPKSLTMNEKLYSSTSVIVCVSTLESYSEIWGAEITIYPKIYESENYAPDSPEYKVTVPDSDFTVTDSNFKQNIVSSEMLPQTGQLWWPVPILTVSGIMIFSLGYITQRRRHDYEN